MGAHQAPAQRRVRIQGGPHGWGRAGRIVVLVLAGGVCARVLPVPKPVSNRSLWNNPPH